MFSIRNFLLNFGAFLLLVLGRVAGIVFERIGVNVTRVVVVGAYLAAFVLVAVADDDVIVVVFFLRRRERQRHGGLLVGDVRVQLVVVVFDV